MKFLHITDLHYLNKYSYNENLTTISEKFENILYKMKNPFLQLDKCLSKIDLNDISFVILSGDLTEGGDEEDYKIFFEKLKFRLNNIPFFITPGNHDTKNFLNSNMVYSFEDLEIISLDSTKKNSPDGEITHEKYLWLKQVLRKNTVKKKIIIMHHHLLQEQSNLPATKVSEEFRLLIRNSNILGILTGHTHKGFEGLFENKPYFTGHNLSFMGIDLNDGRVDFIENSGIYVYEIKNNQISRNFISGYENKRILGTINFKS